jgi:hypothetical protein
MPVPVEMRQRASATELDMRVTWSKARMRWRVASCMTVRSCEGSGWSGATTGSSNDRSMRAVVVLPLPLGPVRMRIGNGPVGEREARSHSWMAGGKESGSRGVWESGSLGRGRGS